MRAGRFSLSHLLSQQQPIHGGLRYLEYCEFRLVREALQEREVLMTNAPHIVRPLRFRLPHSPYLRPAWMIRLGLFLYDTISRRNILPASIGLPVVINHRSNPTLPRCLNTPTAGQTTLDW